MSDLWWAIGLMGMLTAGAFEGVRRLSRRWGGAALLTALLAAAAALPLFLRYVLDSSWMIRALPLKNLVVLGNLTPVVAGVIGGLTCNATRAGPAWRRGGLVATLVLLACYGAWSPVLMRPANVDPTQVASLWRQTTDSSCSAAAAATLLNQFGIPATETEMATLCLTTDRGTTNWGLYRGLRIKTAGTPYSVQTVGLDAVLAGSSPVLLNSGIARGQAVDPAYEPKGGWIRGVNHSVVSLGRQIDGRVAVSDPSRGTELWDDQSLRTLFKGVAFVLRENATVTQGLGLLTH